MDEAVKLAAIALLLCAAAVRAQDGLTDPTQPPAQLQHGGPVNQGGAPASSGPVLQSILIAPHRQVAVIDGEALRVGQKFNGAVLAKISETEVVLMRGGQKEVLRLFPAEENKAAKALQRKDK